MDHQSRIKRLPQHEIQKIAAGEVVERPASVVKELIENAIDAGATTIDLYFQDAGRQKIRIVDNGCGMSWQDARICTEQYTTSKLSSVDELQALTTFGFRGEALASIAAVSQFTLITKDSATTQGMCIKLHNNEQREEIVATITGTDITVDELFHNVPARKKFLKAAETEWRQIMVLLHAFCINYPDIHFTVTHNGTLVLSCPATTRIARIAQLWGTETAGNMLTCTRTHKEKNFNVQAIISHHQVSKFDRSAIFFFVNKRWVKNQGLIKALLKGYMNVLPPGRYPMAALFIDIDPAAIDINIHPRKEEVLFLHAQTVEQTIQKMIHEALEDHLSNQLKRSQNIDHVFSTSLPAPFELLQHRTPESRASMDTQYMATPVAAVVAPSQPESSIITFGPAHQSVQQTLARSLDSSTHFADIVGYYKKTYILIEQDDGLCLIDQHAAHERILYERFSSRFEMLAPNKLILPLHIAVTQDELHVLTKHSFALEKQGIIIEPFGVDQMIITAIPLCLKSQDIGHIIHMVASWYTQEESPSEQDIHTAVIKKLHAMMACKAAIKAGDALTQDQMQELIKDLHSTPNRFTCPHGRPTCWSLPLYEIEKKFKRRS